MLKDLSIKTKLATGFGVIIAIILILLATAYINFTKLSSASEWDRHTLHVLLEANQFETSLLQIQTSTRGFMLTGEESSTRTIPAEEEATRRHLAAITNLTSDNPLQQERLARLGPMMENWINNVIHPLLEKRRALNKQVGVSQQVATPADVLNGAKTIADVRTLIHELSADEERLLAQRSHTSNDLQRSMALLLIVGGGVCVVLALFVGYLLSSALLGPMSKLTAAVGRITDGDQSARAEVVSKDELGDVTVAFNHMAQSIQDSQSKALADANLLKSKVDSLLGVVSKAASGDLTGKIEVSTWDIEQLLKEMQSAVSASVMGMDKFSEEIRRSVGEVRRVADQLSGVMDQAQKLAPQFDAVLQGMQSQAVGAQQISDTMMQLNDATQQTVESLKATSEAVHQLQYAAGDLQTSVANFAVAA